MDRIGFDRLGVGSADRPLLRLLRIGRAHDLAVAEHRIFALQDLHDDGAGGHESAQVVEERPLPVNGVKPFRLVAAHADALRGDHP